MHNIPPYLAQLFAVEHIPKSQLPRGSRKLLTPLFEGGILETRRSGRGESIHLRNKDAFKTWLTQRYPSAQNEWTTPDEATRAQAIALRRDSKTAGAGVTQSVLHFRAFRRKTKETKVTINSKELPVSMLTSEHGLAACAVDQNTTINFQGQVALIENLETFLHAEEILPEISIILNSAGRISAKLIMCLARSSYSTLPILHFPDYDPVGLSDYLRLHSALKGNVKLFLPDDLAERFERFGNAKLLTEKPRNRLLLERLNAVDWPCPESAKVYKLIKTTGCGLEQEALFIRTRHSEIIDRNEAYSDNVPA